MVITGWKYRASTVQLCDAILNGELWPTHGKVWLCVVGVFMFVGVRVFVQWVCGVGVFA